MKSIVPKICKVDGCEKPSHAYNLCPMHYRRLLHGENNDTQSEVPIKRACSVDNCTRRYNAKGLCVKHYRKEYFKTHKRPSEYTCWLEMKQRCLNKDNPRYDNYGGRGIKVC